MKKIALLTIMLSAALAGSSQNYVDIGQQDISSGSEKDQFLPPTFPNAKVQMLIRNDEMTGNGLTAGQQIIGVQWYVITDQTDRDIFFDVYLDDDYVSDTIPSAVVYPTSGAVFTSVNTTHVGVNVLDSGQFNGWHTANFTAPHTWDGTDNMIIQVCRSGFSGAPSDQIAVYSDSVLTMISGYQSQCSSTNAIYALYSKPYMRLITCDISTASLSVNACGSYTSPSGKVFTSSGMYMDTIPNAAGCDSVITINLSVAQATNDSIAVSACGEYTSPGGQMLTASGFYTDTLTSTGGCDSIITIDLTFTSSLTAQVSQSAGVFTCTNSGVTYQWFNCDSNAVVSGETSASFTPGDEGNYAVIISKDACEDTSTCQSINVSAVKEDLPDAISVFPNPVRNTLHVKVSDPFVNGTVLIRNMQGQIVKRERIAGNMQVIDMDVESGMYMLHIVSINRERAAQLVVVQ